MTGFRIERGKFTDAEVLRLQHSGGQFANWPVVYTLSDRTQVYVGESVNVANRMKQHREGKKQLSTMRIVLDDTFNKSACLDLESFLIRLFAGDGKFEVLNGNSGVVDADYFNRNQYRHTFESIFEELRRDSMFTRSIPEIENSDLFKLSPFKALNRGQAIAIENIVEGLLEDLKTPDASSSIVVQGSAGTGKTIVGIYLMKLLRDVANSVEDDEPDHDSLFSDFFVQEHRDLLAGTTIAMIVPQQSLRKSIQRVFKKTPGLQRTEVLSPTEFGKRGTQFDVVVVDEAHRLNHRANQPSGFANKAFHDINVALFGEDRDDLTQLDWIRRLSRHQVFLLDEEQSVRPADLPLATVHKLVQKSKDEHRHHPLESQMRVLAGSDYIDHIRELLTGRTAEGRPDFGEYDLRFFDDPGAMHDEIRALDDEVGLSRMVAGYAWKWVSKNDPAAFDIEIGDYRAQWNRAEKDWISSPGSVNEVGSIHTVQGYDLNYAGVIIGADLRFDPRRGETVFDRTQYFDGKGMENNARLRITYTDEDILGYVRNIYSVLLTRGMLGTFVYVSDPALREHLRARLPSGML